MKVKGATIVDLVKMIRANKDINWDRYFTPEEKQLIQSTVLAINWYPADILWSLQVAVFREIGKGQIENVFLFGKMTCKSRLRVYKHLLIKGDPAASIKNCITHWMSFYDFEGASYKPMEAEYHQDSVKITAYEYPTMNVPEIRRVYFHGLAGFFHEVVEQAIGRETVDYKLENRGVQVDITISWQ
jgi:hypothetical protein